MNANEAFDTHLRSLPIDEYRKMSKEIRKTFVISSTVFANWCSGRTRIPPFYRREINRILGKDIFSEVVD